MVNIYSCPFAKCEIISDSYPMVELNELGAYSVQSTVRVDNDPYSDTNGEKINDVVKGFDYQEVTYTKKQYIGYFKLYLKTLLAWMKENKPDEVAQFQKDAVAFMKFFMKKKKDDLGFWMNEANNSDGYVPWGDWKENSADGPVMMYFKYGLKMKKC